MTQLYYSRRPMRSQVTSLFSERGVTLDFVVTDRDQRAPLPADRLSVNVARRELVLDGMDRLPSQTVYYWKLPQKFINNKVRPRRTATVGSVS